MSGLSCSWIFINRAGCDKSFRQVPTFGQDTIRRFHKNVLGLKRLAARDFEDILQVSTSSESFYHCLGRTQHDRCAVFDSSF